MKNWSVILLLLLGYATMSFSQPYRGERLSRSFVGIPVSKGMYFSWRMLLDDSPNKGFDIYRVSKKGKAQKLNKDAITKTSDFMDETVNLHQDNLWILKSEGKELARWERKKDASTQPYLSIPICRPQSDTIAGRKYFYTANDCSVGDLDGDGEYEIILKWSPSISRRPPERGFSGNTYLDAYKMNGKMLWRISLGNNIRSGAATTNFLVFDFDGDGKAELCCKTGDGTIDGEGNAIGDSHVDWRDWNPASKTYGKIVRGTEYLTVFDGLTGKALDTQEYIPTRYPLDGWGGIGGNGKNDNTGGRSDRFTACVAFLDGKTPSPVMIRGWYGRTVVAAWTFKEGKLRHIWSFDSAKPGLESYSGMGNHSVTVADFDGDGCDEVCVGAMTVDHNGKGLFTTGLRHGDALHAGRLIPTRQGLQVFGIHENEGNSIYAKTGAGVALFDGKTGEIIWKDAIGLDVGRGVAADIDPRFQGAECWCTEGGLRRGDTGEIISSRKPMSCNFTLFWDADPLAELLDGTTISKWNWETEQTDLLMKAEGVVSNNGTKANPCLSGDILGDWREEVIWASEAQDELRIYTTSIPAQDRRPTLMSDRQYRLAIAWQNVGYNQPPHTSYDLMDTHPSSHVSALNAIEFQDYWKVESESADYTLSFIGDTVDIIAPKGLTLWRKDKMKGKLTIEYDACVIKKDSTDRLSDLNCFWMASDPQSPQDLWQRSEWRNGVFKRCYSLQLYYVGFGGNHNSTTRFRRYQGDERGITDAKFRPAILKEYKDEQHLLKANHWYHIRLTCDGQQVTYSIDGEQLVDYLDPSPLTEGWFGFRTTLSHVRMAHFNYTQQE